MPSGAVWYEYYCVAGWTQVQHAECGVDSRTVEGRVPWMYLGQLPKLSITRRTISPFLFVSTRQFSLQPVVTAPGSPDGMVQAASLPQPLSCSQANALACSKGCKTMD